MILCRFSISAYTLSIKVELQTNLPLSSTQLKSEQQRSQPSQSEIVRVNSNQTLLANAIKTLVQKQRTSDARNGISDKCLNAATNGKSLVVTRNEITKKLILDMDSQMTFLKDGSPR